MRGRHGAGAYRQETQRGGRTANVGRLAAICVCALVLPLAGCGTGDSERDVARTIERFQAAVAERDGAAACAQLTEAARGAVESDEDRPCDQGVLELDVPDAGAVTRTAVYVTSAFAEIDGQGTAFLAETPAGWRIDAIGCVYTGPDKPYDCELET